MPNKVKHLRGSADEWAENDIVIDDGEIALIRTECGRYRMKIGNGELLFSELETFGGEVVYPDYDEVYLNHALDARYEEIEVLTVYLPDAIDEDYYSLLTFTSGPVATELCIESNMYVRFSGSSITGGAFIPLPNMHYTLAFWYDGEIQCHVRGVSNA